MRSNTLSALALATCVAFVSPARAEIADASADHFLVGFAAEVAAPPAKVHAALVKVGAWWSSAHTWSGAATNLSLDARAGGCFCERWAEGSAEHGRVLKAIGERELHVATALGPLQDMAVNGVLSFRLEGDDAASTHLLVDYRVNGVASSGLDQIAPAVDQVLGEQVDRLLRYIDTGDPEPPEAAQGKGAPSRRQTRAALLEQWAAQLARKQSEQANKDDRKP